MYINLESYIGMQMYNAYFNTIISWRTSSNDTPLRGFHLVWAALLSFPRAQISKILSQIWLGWTLSWRRALSYRNQSINLLCKSMNWFLYDRDLRHEGVKVNELVLWEKFLKALFQVHYRSTFSQWLTHIHRKNLWSWKRWRNVLLCIKFLFHNN